MKRVSALAGVFCAILSHASANASEATFKDQKISILIGYGVGGGYDVYGRLVARFLPKYLPGNPVVIAQNMTGAGSLRAADFIYNVAPKDGTTLGVIGQTIPIDQLMEEGKKTFDSSKFTWIGRMASGVETITTWHTSPVQSIQQAKKSAANIAATGPSSGSAIYPVVLNSLIGTKFKVVSGYAGTKEMLLAMERGEADGCGAINASTLTSEFPHWLSEKKVTVITQISTERHPAFPDVPTLVELGTTERQKQILKLFAASGDIGRALMAPPGVPRERTDILRKAFMQMMADKELLELAAKNNFDISPMEGSALQKFVTEIGDTPESIIVEARTAKTAAY